MNSSISSVSLTPPLTFSPTADRRNSALQNPRTSICKGEAHTLKPTSLNLPPSCLVTRLAYVPPLSSAFIGVRQRNRFWQLCKTRVLRSWSLSGLSADGSASFIALGMANMGCGAWWTGGHNGTRTLMRATYLSSCIKREGLRQKKVRVRFSNNLKIEDTMWSVLSKIST